MGWSDIRFNTAVEKRLRENGIMKGRITLATCAQDTTRHTAGTGAVVFATLQTMFT